MTCQQRATKSYQLAFGMAVLGFVCAGCSGGDHNNGQGAHHATQTPHFTQTHQATVRDERLPLVQVGPRTSAGQAGRVIEGYPDSESHTPRPEATIAQGTRDATLDTYGPADSATDRINELWDSLADDNVARWHYGDKGDVDFRGHDFTATDMRHVDLTGADLQEANMAFTDFRGAGLRNTNLKDAVIKRTILRGADLRGATLQGTDMGSVNLNHADLRGANLRDGRMACRDCGASSVAMGANFSGADLSGLNFDRTVIYASVFEQSDLRGANMAQTIGRPLSLRGALYDHKTRLPARINPMKEHMVYMPSDGATPKSQ